MMLRLAVKTPLFLPRRARWGMWFFCAALLALDFAPGARAASPQAPATSTTQAIMSAPPDESFPEITPPLSIYESCVLTEDAARLLTDSAPSTATLRQVDRMLNAVILYVDRIDRTHSTLPFYAWDSVSSEKAPRDGWETQVFKLLNPIPQVTALAIRARHGDLEIKYLAAIDRNQTRWEFKKPIHVPAEQPRPEIFFLSLPTDLAEIRITCCRSDPKGRWPRLFIDAGVSSIPESAKQAIYYLQLTRAEIKMRRFQEARQHVRLACDHLKDYLKNRRF